MFFYSETMETVLSKQKLSAYIQESVIKSREHKMMPASYLVQVVTNNTISDTKHDYPCNFTGESFRVGSYIRMTKWEVDMSKYQLVIHEAQYLGGAGCQVKHGKKWDLDKLKNIYNSNIYSKNFVVVFQPSPKISDLVDSEAGIELFDGSMIDKKRDKVGQQKVQDVGKKRVQK